MTTFLHLRTGLLASVLSLATFTQVFGQPAPSVLFYPNESTESSFLPTNATFTVASDMTWRAMRTSDFAKYDLIIIGEAFDGAGPTTANLLAAYDTRNTWAAAITGRIVVSGMDPSYHASQGGVLGAGMFLAATLDWLTKGALGKTALYVSSDWGTRNLDFLSPFGAFSSSAFHADTITITSPDHPIMIGSTSASLSDWFSSAHSCLTYPASFSNLATGTGLNLNLGSVVTGSVVVARDTVLLPPSVQPLLQGKCVLSGYVGEVAVSENYAYLATWNGGLQVIDVSDPANCARVGGYDIRGRALGVAVVADRIYVAASEQGLLVLPTLPNVQFTVRVDATTNETFTLEAATNLNSPIPWMPLVTTNVPVMPFDFVDFDVKLSEKPQKYYRVRQP